MLLVALAIYSSFATGQYSEQTYSRQHDILVAAIANPEMEVSGILIGSEVVAYFSDTFKSDGTLHVRAKVVSNGPVVDCKRLLVTYIKDDVLTLNGVRPVSVSVKMNYCLYGPPVVKNQFE